MFLYIAIVERDVIIQISLQSIDNIILVLSRERFVYVAITYLFFLLQAAMIIVYQKL